MKHRQKPPRFNPWAKRLGKERPLYHRLVLGELVGLLRVPNEAGYLFDHTDKREVATLEAKGISPEGAAVELALRAGLEVAQFVGLCPYCAEWLPDHRAGCQVPKRVLRFPSSKRR